MNRTEVAVIIIAILISAVVYGTAWALGEVVSTAPKYIQQFEDLNKGYQYE